MPRLGTERGGRAAGVSVLPPRNPRVPAAGRAPGPAALGAPRFDGPGGRERSEGAKRAPGVGLVF